MYLDDLTPGFTFRTGSRTLSRDEIVDFARAYDPQPFHLDEDAAAASHFGGIVASGFHTLLVAFVLTLDADVWREASMGSPGMDELRWLRPVRPGDSLTAEGKVVSVTPSRSRPDRGRAVIDYTVRNQAGDAVMTYKIIHILARRA